MSDYLSFEEVLGELNISEEDLKRMVSEGELRAFREENKMKFRRDDVVNLKSGGRPSEPTVVFDGGGGGGEEGTILELDSGELPAVPQETAVPELDFGGGGEAPAEAPAEDAGETTGITQEMVFEDSDALKVQPTEESSEAAETFTEESSDTAGGTEALQVENEPGAAEGAAEEGGEAAVTEEEAPAPRARGRAAAEVSAPAEPLAPSKFATAVMMLAAVVMLFAGYVLVDLIRCQSGDGDPNGSEMVKKIRNVYPGEGKPAIEGAGTKEAK